MTASEIKFIPSIGTLGSDRMIINIPKKYNEQAKEMKGKEVIVIIREALE
ncbi:MAG: hypothetical protein ACM3VV_06720 [Deltaproteobacteria bacterium]